LAIIPVRKWSMTSGTDPRLSGSNGVSRWIDRVVDVRHPGQIRQQTALRVGERDETDPPRDAAGGRSKEGHLDPTGHERLGQE
jgi:hypothetical protein